MDIVMGGPRMGKTTRMIEAVKKDKNAVLVVHTEAERKWAIERGLPREQIISSLEFTSGRLKGHPNKNLYVENIERYAQLVAGPYNRVVMGTLDLSLNNPIVLKNPASKS